MKKLSIQEIHSLVLEITKDVHEICINNNISYYLIGGSLIGAVRNHELIPWDDDIDLAMLRTDYEQFIRCAREQLPSYLYIQNMFTDEGFVYPLTRICYKGTYRKEKYERKEKQYLYIDIFPIDFVPDSKVKRFIHKNQIRFLKQVVLRTTCPVLDKKSGKIKNIAKVLLKKIIPGTSLFWKHQLNKSMSRYTNTYYVSSLASKYGYSRQIIPCRIYGKPCTIELCGYNFLCPQYYEKYLHHLYGDYMKPPQGVEFNTEIYLNKEIYDAKGEEL